MSPEETVRKHEEMLENRIRKSLRKWQKRFEREGVTAFRLYDRDIPEIRMAVDWYAGHLVAAEYARTQTDELPNWLERMGEACARGAGVELELVHLKSRRTRPQHGLRYARTGQSGDEVEVREGGLSFLVNLEDHIDTGLFLDHRTTRAMVRAESDGRRVLNLFGYTGSFSCYAADGGAPMVVTVDRSKQYLAWAKRNIALNGQSFSSHDLVRSDVGPFLERTQRSRERFDLAIVDPPSYSTQGHESQAFDVQRDHPELLRDVLRVMRRGGVVYFSTNHQSFSPRLKTLRASKVDDISEQTIPPDYRNRQVHRVFRIEV